MRKIVLLIIIYSYVVNVFSQENELEDIAFKAKLFTVSEYGVDKKDIILTDIENQKLDFLKTKYKKFVFMRIKFSQPYRIPKDREQTLNRVCSYYLAFNTKDSRYYKLGGFSNLDIDAFFKDLEAVEDTIFGSIEEGQEVEGIDISCLFSYYELSKRKRLRKGFSCFDNCCVKTETKITTY
ncbi:hypothetical protein [Tenacibaculum discolor]|uniref:hypothetical protein n=1 Tax=Tenacibaculum discolor TaxID=361581 RepID=UPI003F7A7D36